MISDRTKQFIFNNLIKDLSNAEIIRHDESLWFIDREKKYWYLELVKTGKLYWRYQFFTEFFNMYSIDRDVYEPIIKEFVELVLNNNITSTAAAQGTGNKPLEDALNYGITSTQVEYGVFRNEKVEDALNNGVTSSRPANKSLTIVDEVLNDGVTSMGFTNRDKPFIVDSVLSNGITSTHEIAGLSNDIVNSVLTNGVTTKLRGGNATEQIKYILNDGITSTGSNRLLSHTKLDLILKKGVSNLMPLDAYRENMINYVLKDNPS